MLSSQSAWADRAVDKAVIEAFKNRKEKKVLTAMEILKTVEKQASGNAGFFAERAAEYVDLDKYDLAMKDCNEAIRLDPKLADAYDRRAFCYAMADQLDKALADYNTAIKLDPRSPMAYHNRAIALKKLGRMAEAQKDMNKYMTLRPGRLTTQLTQVIKTKAEDLERDGNLNGSIDYLKAQVAATPSATLHLHLGSLYQKSGDQKQAIEQFDSAIKLAKTDPDQTVGRRAELKRSISQYRLKNYAAAIKDASAVIEKCKKAETVSSTKTIAREDRESKKLPQAMADANLVIASSPDMNSAYESRGAIYQAMGKQFPKAIQDFSKALKANPDSEPSHLGRAGCYEALKQYDKALQDYSAVIERSPNAAKEAYKGRSHVYHLLKDEKHAESDLAKAQEAQPD
jgi:tetratricopeptide (TPR) repeat protein